MSHLKGEMSKCMLEFLRDNKSGHKTLRSYEPFLTDCMLEGEESGDSFKHCPLLLIEVYRGDHELLGRLDEGERNMMMMMMMMMMN